MLLGGGLFASIVSFIYPVLRYLIPPPVADLGGDEVVASKVGDLKPNGSKIFRFGTRPALLLMTAEGEYRALIRCLHALELHRSVSQRPPRNLVRLPQRFVRPDWTQYLSGPPPRPLESYTVHVRGDEIVVSRKREA